MKSQLSIKQLISEPRLEAYLRASGYNEQKALELYQWAMQLSGALHTQISYVEIAVRNSVDMALREWNRQHSLSVYWSLENNADELLYSLIGKPLREARKNAVQESLRRPRSHPRKGNPVAHDDVVSQLTLGTWSNLVGYKSHPKNQQLWEEALHKAFPFAEDAASVTCRQEIGRQLETLRRLRNRVAHHDNLLEVRVTHRLNGMLALLAKINPDYVDFATAKSPVREISRLDPR